MILDYILVTQIFQQRVLPELKMWGRGLWMTWIPTYESKPGITHISCYILTDFAGDEDDVSWWKVDFLQKQIVWLWGCDELVSKHLKGCLGPRVGWTGFYYGLVFMMMMVRMIDISHRDLWILEELNSGATIQGSVFYLRLKKLKIVFLIIGIKIFIMMAPLCGEM